MLRMACRTIAWVLLVSAAVSAGAAAQDVDDATVVIAVRHAERADQGPGADPMISSTDPQLSTIGLARAACLASTLEHAGVTRVFTTPYARTRQTAEPVAQMAGVEVEEYDPRRMSEFVDRLHDMGGVVVVVGHSNTTPGLVEALGGDPVGPIAEDEYERLYTVFVSGDTVRSTLVSFCPAS